MVVAVLPPDLFFATGPPPNLKSCFFLCFSCASGQFCGAIKRHWTASPANNHVKTMWQELGCCYLQNSCLPSQLHWRVRATRVRLLTRGWPSMCRTSSGCSASRPPWVPGLGDGIRPGCRTASPSRSRSSGGTVGTAAWPPATHSSPGPGWRPSPSTSFRISPGGASKTCAWPPGSPRRPSWKRPGRGSQFWRAIGGCRKASPC